MSRAYMIHIIGLKLEDLRVLGLESRIQDSRRRSFQPRVPRILGFVMQGFGLRILGFAAQGIRTMHSHHVRPLAATLWLSSCLLQHAAGCDV